MRELTCYPICPSHFLLRNFPVSLHLSHHLSTSSLPCPDSYVLPAMFEVKSNSQKQNSGVTLNICLSTIFPSHSLLLAFWCSPLINVLTSRGGERYCGATVFVLVGVWAYVSVILACSPTVSVSASVSQLELT